MSISLSDRDICCAENLHTSGGQCDALRATRSGVLVGVDPQTQRIPNAVSR